VEGLKVVLKIFPEGMTTGTPPAELTGTKAKVTRPADQTCFLTDDINKVEICLDAALQDKGTSSEYQAESLSDITVNPLTPTPPLPHGYSYKASCARPG